MMGRGKNAVPVLLFAIVLAAPPSTAARKTPSPEDQEEMRWRLQESAHHVLHGGPSAAKLDRAHQLVKMHGGFVTDMIKQYRPSLMSRWLKRTSMFHRLFPTSQFGLMGDAQGRRLDEGPGSDTGVCFDTYKDEWACVTESCWCDRALSQSAAGPDKSTSCDDGSEYVVLLLIHAPRETLHTVLQTCTVVLSTLMGVHRSAAAAGIRAMLVMFRCSLSTARSRVIRTV